MKIVFLFIFSTLISNIALCNELFKTEEYIIEFQSENINIVKIEKINEIKIKSFLFVLKDILSEENYKKIKTITNFEFVDNFILSMKINSEKIVNQNYYSKVKINFNSELLIQYLIKNKINFINTKPKLFLLLIHEEDKLKNNFLSKNNKLYKFLKEKNNSQYLKYFILPNLDFNDRYLLDIDDVINKNYNRISVISEKYQAENTIILYLKKIDNSYDVEVSYLYNKNHKLILKKTINKLSYIDLLNEIYFKALDNWKLNNEINTSVNNSVICNININNFNELKFIRSILKSTIVIKDFELIFIMLNQNTYKINYYGNIDNLIKSLEKRRLNLIFNKNNCKIKLI